MVTSVYLSSLGCPKNLIDSEELLFRLELAGHKICGDPGKAETIIVNTCGFIESAITESIDTILELATYKKNGVCRQLIVAGCASERFQLELAEQLPEVDIFIGTGGLSKIPELIGADNRKTALFFPDPNLKKFPLPYERKIDTTTVAAYIKIAEGCDRKCTYCIIPKLRGKYRSRTAQDICNEAAILGKKGIKEIILIAQDTTGYGTDLASSTGFGYLLKKISQIASDISDLIKIRVLYCHPESIDNNIIKIICETENIYSYFDIPIQHASERILKKMGRKYGEEELDRIFDKIRYYDSDAAIRTTVMIGFPQETEKDFEKLCRFAEKTKFDHLGAFIYSDAEDIAAHRISGHRNKKTAEKRFDFIMKLQAKISYENNRKHINRIYDVLIEEQSEDNLFIARAWFQAPEIDGIVYVSSRKKLDQKKIVKVKITDASEYDLFGEHA